MIDYALAKELAEAGFPQGGNGRWLVNPEAIVARAADRAYAPTLEELIEACGEKFHSLEWDLDPQKIWVAFPRPEFLHGAAYYGEKPTIAVARLWLALHKTR